jgi:disulfide oxidoreductase YuzD
MNRSVYYNYIDEKLHILAYRIITGGKLNMLSSHMHSENFYLYFFNLLYNYELENLNQYLQNIEAIDLIDHTNKVAAQVSSINTKAKIESALEKDIFKKYSDYTFKFISIAKDASNLRKNSFQNPHSISFNPAEDIYDIKSILNKILNCDIDRQKEIYRFIKKELGNEINIVKLESNLATIINILAKEKWDEVNKPDPLNRFEIERKIVYNDLDSAKRLIEEYSLYYGKVDSKYSEFDSLGSNKSNSVLATFKREYLRIEKKKDADQTFFSVTDAIKNKIEESSNYVQIPIDELELCIDILTVDAFIRCKIFENPKGYNYVTP